MTSTDDNNFEKSPWHALWSKKDLEIMEYAADLKVFNSWLIYPDWVLDTCISFLGAGGCLGKNKAVPNLSCVSHLFDIAKPSQPTQNIDIKG